MHVCPMVTGVVPHVGGPIVAPGAPTVLVGNLPAARVGDVAVCVGPPDFIAPPGAPTVLIGGRPAARMGDMTVHGGRVILGCFRVLIGNAGAQGVGIGGAASVAPCVPPVPCLGQAKKSGTPFVKVPAKRASGKKPPQSNVYKSRPTVPDLTSDPLVDAELKRAWAESNPGAPEVPSGQAGSIKQEQGGWIVWNKNTGKVQVVRVLPGTRDGLGTIAGTRPSETGGDEVVGWFHTHPNTAKEGYTADPSPGDKGFQRAYAKAPGIIETHEGRKTIPYP